MLAERRDREHYYRAIRLAKFSEYPIRVGATAASNGKVLAGAFNTIRNSNPGTEFGHATYHAEHNCIRMVPPRLLTRITLYVARIDRKGHRVPSRPCSKCMKLLAEYNIREVVYFDGEFIVKERL